MECLGREALERDRTALNYHLPDMEYAGVYEDQARGAVHLHLLVRLPGFRYTEKIRETILRQAARVSALSPDTGKRHRWGEQVDVRVVLPGKELGKSIWYLLKAVNYLTKEISDDGGLRSDRQVDHWRALGHAAREHRCAGCREKAGRVHLSRKHYCFKHDPGGGLLLAETDGWGFVILPDFSILDPATGVFLNPETFEVLGETADCPECAALRCELICCDGVLHSRNGRRAQTIVMSRGYRGEGGWSMTKVTRRSLKARRADWAREQYDGIDAQASADASFRRARDVASMRNLVERYELYGTTDPVP